MSGLLQTYALDDIEQGARKHILDIMADLDAANAWREKQPDYETRLNHPTNVWRGWQRSSRKQDHRDANRKPNKAEQTAIELAAALQHIEELNAHVAELEAARDITPVDNPTAPPADATTPSGVLATLLMSDLGATQLKNMPSRYTSIRSKLASRVCKAEKTVVGKQVDFRRMPSCGPQCSPVLAHQAEYWGRRRHCAPETAHDHPSLTRMF